MIKKTQNGYSVDIRPTGRNGKRFRKTLPTKAEAMAYEKWVITEHSQKEPWQTTKRDNRKLSELAHTWYRLHGKNIKTGKTRLRELLVLIDKMGDPPAYQFTASFFVKFRSQRLETVTANTANHDLSYFRALFNELKRLGEWHSPNPLADIRKVKETEKEQSYLEIEQIKQLVTELDTHTQSHARIQARICLATGARWEETIVKASNVRAGKIHFTDTKNGKNRAVPIDKELAKLIKDNAPIKDGINTFKRTIKRTGIPLQKGQLTRVLRHTFASWYMINGGNILTLQRILGHGSITMTMRYSHLSPDHLKDALDKNPLVTTFRPHPDQKLPSDTPT